jgi:hypothetical protein
VGELQSRIRAVTDKTEALAEKPSVAPCRLVTTRSGSAAMATFQNEVITMAGGPTRSVRLRAGYRRP